MAPDGSRGYRNTVSPRYGSNGRGHHEELPAVLSLFCGPGGMDLGFRQAGFAVPLAIDHCPAAVRTHRRNMRKSVALQADLVDLGSKGVAEELAKHLPKGRLLGIIGGPPCQGFSRANIRSTKDDPRNRLPDSYLEIVKALCNDYDVRFVVMENVLGIRDKKHASTFESLVEKLAGLGFETTVHEVLALDFGVPQRRRRVILTGIRKGAMVKPLVLRPYRGMTTVKEAIGSIRHEPAYFSRALSREEIPLHPNHWTMNPRSPRFGSVIPRSTAKHRSFKRLEWDQPSPTVAYGNREIHVHPSGKRRLSIYEALLLQGFPKRWVLEGNFSQQVEQVSNAVPPPVARAVARAVQKSLGSWTNGC